MNKYKRKVSVIVPVYNVEDSLGRCIDSILIQEYQDFEIILVDDGSKDLSGEICDNFQKRNSIIKVVHKENGGLGSARNAGIEIAQGEYICFIDSDDEIKQGYLKYMVEAIERNCADICICGYDYIAGRNITEFIYAKNSNLSGKDLLIYFASGNSIFYYAWNKLYKMELIRDIRFSERHCAEDMYFNMFYYRNVKKVAIVDKALYKYYVNNYSLTNNVRANFWKDMLQISDQYMANLKINNLDTSYVDNLLLIMFRNSLSNYCSSKTCNYRGFKEYLEIEHSISDLKLLQPNKECVGLIDKVILSLLKKEKYRAIYYITRMSKIAKRRFVSLFIAFRKIVTRS